MKGLFDLDIVVYVVGSACDGRHYMYKGQKWESKKLLDKQLIEDGVDPLSITVKKDPEPWENARRSLNSYIEDIVERSGAIDWIGFLSGNSNFRYDVATILPYKGNRSSIEKPFHYDSIRQHLMDNYPVEISINMEADDAIGLAHDPERTFIATIDKDLDCVPGLHFNWMKEDCYWITDVQSYRNFYKQLLTGDQTDNILGLYGVGKASKLLKDIQEMDEEVEMYQYCKQQYKIRFGNYWKQFMKETARLLWISQGRKNLIMDV